MRLRHLLVIGAIPRVVLLGVSKTSAMVGGEGCCGLDVCVVPTSQLRDYAARTCARAAAAVEQLDALATCVRDAGSPIGAARWPAWSGKRAVTSSQDGSRGEAWRPRCRGR